MGLGGMLLWTAVARELVQRNPGKRIIFVTPPTRWDRIRRRKWGSTVKSEIFDNNPHIVTTTPFFKRNLIPVCVDDARAHYFTEVDDKHIAFRHGKHAIEYACGAFGIEAPEIRCDIFLTEAERQTAKDAVGDISEFVVIEPHTKDEFTPNKRWPLENWQKVVDELHAELTFVQIGLPGGAALSNVRDLSGKLTFRESCAVLERALLFAGPEGGLMHAASAVRKRSVIVFGGYVSPRLMSYPGNINLVSSVDCAPCGLRTPCPFDLKCMQEIGPAKVVSAIRRLADECRNEKPTPATPQQSSFQHSAHVN